MFLLAVPSVPGGGGVAGRQLLGTSDLSLWPSRALLPPGSLLEEGVTGASLLSERSQR